MQNMGLNNCENAGCLLHNCDGANEAINADSMVMLCPTCFRALQLLGGFDDGVAVLMVNPSCRTRATVPQTPLPSVNSCRGNTWNFAVG